MARLQNAAYMPTTLKAKWERANDSFLSAMSHGKNSNNLGQVRVPDHCRLSLAIL